MATACTAMVSTSVIQCASFCRSSSSGRLAITTGEPALEASGMRRRQLLTH